MVGHPRPARADPRRPAWDKPQTEAYAEPAPTGGESRGYLTILGAGTLGGIQEWDGRGFGEDGTARIGRFADGADARIRILVPRDVMSLPRSFTESAMIVTLDALDVLL